MVESETKELSILPAKLREGMVLSQDLRTAKGLLVLTKETKVGARELERINHLNRISPMVNPASVYAD